MGALCFFQNKDHTHVQQIFHIRRCEDGFKNIHELSSGTFPSAFTHALGLIVLKIGDGPCSVLNPTETAVAGTLA